MSEAPNSKPYDLEERTFDFARRVAPFCQELPRSATNLEYGRQLIRASGSVGANYIQGNESLGKKDFQMRIKICRKEAKESGYWIGLIIEVNREKFTTNGLQLLDEASQLKKIFSSILQKSK